jgi:hypothetical protein
MSESFLSQLQQRTQQVKITLANLEAEKVRIENLISQLQPLVPQYDALISAERVLEEANISIDVPPQSDEQTPPWMSGGSEQAQTASNWN